MVLYLLSPKSLYNVRNSKIATKRANTEGDCSMKRNTGLYLTSFALLILAFFAMTPMVHAAPNYSITQIEIDDIIVTGTFDVERDQDLDIEVVLTGAGNITGGVIDNVRIEAEIIGYEFGPIIDATPIFSVDQGITYRKTLRLHIPNDIDSSKTYTLRIRASDPIDQEEQTVSLNIDEQRHDLNIVDAFLTPSIVQAGKPVFAKVRVENLGEKEEDDIKVVVSIPQLGVSESGYIPRLVTQQQEQHEQFFERMSSDEIDFILRAPEDAQTGDYTVQIDVIYNRGNSRISETRKLSVQALPQASAVETVINPETTFKTIKIGEEGIYKVMVANLGTEKGVYSIQLDGTQWADAHVEPGFLTVLPGSTGEFQVFVTPISGADARTYSFNARVMQGTEVVSDVILQAKVEPAQQQSSSPATFKMVLAGIFGLLVVILIILGIIVAYKKTTENNEAAGAAEGQTYYYSPKK